MNANGIGSCIALTFIALVFMAGVYLGAHVTRATMLAQGVTP